MGMKLPILCLFVYFSFLIPMIQCLQVETLEDCERSAKKFCYTGIVPDRHLINQAISQDVKLQKLYEQLKPSYDEIEMFDRRTKREDRITREATTTQATDCTTVCCANSDLTAPFSYYNDVDGWSQVASTPEFPMRVTFFTEKCSHANSPCRGVRSTDDELQPLCEQIEQKHTILLFNKTAGGLQSRYISVPSSCKCRLKPKNPFNKGAKISRRKRNIVSNKWPV